jgi:hypothetical protein
MNPNTRSGRLSTRLLKPPVAPDAILFHRWLLARGRVLSRYISRQIVEIVLLRSRGMDRIRPK